MRWQTFLENLRGVAEIRATHPSWWGPLLAFALRPDALARCGDGTPRGYRNANGGSDSDTFMARPLVTPRNAADQVARAVVRARTALDVLTRLAGTFEAQTFLGHLVEDHHWIAPAPLPSGSLRVAFVLANHVYLGAVERGQEDRLAADLAAAVAGDTDYSEHLVEIDTEAVLATPAAVAIGLFPTSLVAARHLHRRAWTRGGGPWLGVSDTGDLGVVSTCHVAVDGYAHALVTSAVLDASDDLGRLHAVAAEQLGSQPAVPPSSSSGLFAARTVTSLSFRRQAYAFGRALDRFYGPHLPPTRRSRRFSPVFQVPVVPGGRDDPTRVRRRALHALISLRKDGDGFESFEAFARRVPDLLAAERAGGGVLAELAACVAHLPLPLALRRRLLSTHRLPRPWLPSMEALCGRGRLSVLSFAPGEAPPLPLYAASAPPLFASRHDPAGSLVMTVVRHGEESTVSVFGTGLAASREGAEAFLDVWTEQLEPLTIP